MILRCLLYPKVKEDFYFLKNAIDFIDFVLKLIIVYCDLRNLIKHYNRRTAQKWITDVHLLMKEEILMPDIP